MHQYRYSWDLSKAACISHEDVLGTEHVNSVSTVREKPASQQSSAGQEVSIPYTL